MSEVEERHEEARPPPGFEPIRFPKSDGFTKLAGPWFAREQDGKLVGGFRVMAHHVNPNGVCHGGMIATFCDVFLAVAAIRQGKLAARMIPTISLSLDFLAPIAQGAWVEGRVELLRAGRRIVFAQGLLSVDGEPVVRASGVFNVPQPKSAEPLPAA